MTPTLGMIQILYSVILVFFCTLISFILGVRLEKKIFLATVRAVIQLILLGYLLVIIFKYNQPLTLALVFLFMVFVASRTSLSRVKRSHKGLFTVAFGSIFVSGIITGLYTFFLAIPQDPWFEVQHTIPLVGMILGNSLNGISLSLDKFTDELVLQKNAIEDRLALGASRMEASRDIVKESIRTGLTPILNAMMVVGLVSIPGMMTGQILAGNDPLKAAKYQMVILLLIFCSCFLSILGVVFITFYRLFDKEHRFCEKLYQELLL